MYQEKQTLYQRLWHSHLSVPVYGHLLGIVYKHRQWTTYSTESFSV